MASNHLHEQPIKDPEIASSFEEHLRESEAASEQGVGARS
jgi:hypothetical protein